MSTKTYTATPVEQKKRKKKRKKYNSPTSQLENPEKLQLHLNHEKILFLTVLLLFA
jgi:hypothetical protein